LEFRFPSVSAILGGVVGSSLLPIYLVVLVDLLGFSIVSPLLPFYAERFGASPLLATLLVSAYALCALLSTPVIGRLSDRFGRRRLLLLSQIGTCAGLLVLGFSDTLWMVFLGRTLDGATAGNFVIAQAYISDRTPAEDRSKAFGRLGIAFGIGFFIGPAMAGALVEYGLHVPFLAAAGLSFCSMVCSYVLLEPGTPNPSAAASARAPIAAAERSATFHRATYINYLRRSGLGSLYLQFFLSAFAFSAISSGFALFAERRFTTSEGRPWTSREVGFTFAYSGFLGIFIQGWLLGYLVRWFGEARLAIAGFFSITIAYVVLGLTDTLFWLIVVSTISAFGSGVLRSVLASQITQQVSSQEQGIALGISASLNSLAMMLAPPVAGVLIGRGWLEVWCLVPSVATALCLIVAMGWPAAAAGGQNAGTSNPSPP
jgi:MFS transporter, DHA1 family, tetracycline resistance protein